MFSFLKQLVEVLIKQKGLVIRQSAFTRALNKGFTAQKLFSKYLLLQNTKKSTSTYYHTFSIRLPYVLNTEICHWEHRALQVLHSQ